MAIFYKKYLILTEIYFFDDQNGIFKPLGWFCGTNGQMKYFDQAISKIYEEKVRFVRNTWLYSILF